MPGLRTVTKLYILFNHALFGQGIRSLLRGRRAIQIVGMEKDEAKSLEAMEALQPEVVIIEQSGRGIGSSTLGAILRKPGVGRVVTLNLGHNYATVYDRRCLTTARPEDLVNAIRGAGKRKKSQVAVPDPKRGKAAMGTRPAAGRRFITS